MLSHSEKIKKISALFLLSFLFFGTAEAASLSISPSSGKYEAGDRITARVVVSSDTSVNAVSGTLTLPTSLFTIESVSKTNSVIDFWVTEPSFSQSQGTISFEGVKLSGFTGDKTIVTISLIAKTSGDGLISFKSGQVLANDGVGTDVTKSKSGATYSVVPAAIKITEPAPATPVVPTAKKETPKKTVEVEIVDEELPEEEPICESPFTCDGSIEIMTIKEGRKHVVFGKSSLLEESVLLVFTAEDGSNFSVLTRTNDHGEFVSSMPQSLKKGVYEVFAQKIDTDNELVGSRSNDLTLLVDGEDTSWIMRYLDLAALVLSFIILSMVLMTYNRTVAKKKARRIKKSVPKEISIEE